VSGEELLFWGLGLLAASLLLVIIEVFVPSGGLIAVTAAGCAVVGVVFLFKYQLAWGISGTLAILILGPTSFGFALRVWPSTPIGRRMLGAKTPEEEEADRLAQLKERQKQQSLIGAEGTVVTDLRPVGIILVDNARMEALSESGFIRAGAKVRITMVESNQIKVRQV
jgi:membrane-bound ClpP family serine protease